MRLLDFAADPNNPQLLIWNSTGEHRFGTTYTVDGRFLGFTSLDAFGEWSIGVMSGYTGEILHDFGDFAEGEYFLARFTAANIALVAQDGVITDADGTAIISGSDPRHSTNGCGSNCNSTGTSGNLYRTIIPAANSIGLNFNIPSW